MLATISFDVVGTGQSGIDFSTSFPFSNVTFQGASILEPSGTTGATVNASNANADPVAQDDSFTTAEDTLLSDDVFADNGNGADSDPNVGDVLSVTEVNGVAAGVGTQITLGSGALLTLNSDGTFDYDPNGVFDALNDTETDTDTFSYTIDDGNGNTDTADVTVTINGVDDETVVYRVNAGGSSQAAENGTLPDWTGAQPIGNGAGPFTVEPGVTVIGGSDFGNNNSIGNATVPNDIDLSNVAGGPAPSRSSAPNATATRSGTSTLRTEITQLICTLPRSSSEFREVAQPRVQVIAFRCLYRGNKGSR